MAVNKIIANGNTLIDLTADTVTADKLAKGYTAHNKAGEIITGTMESGSTRAVQYYRGYKAVKSTSYTASGVKVTVSKSGVYTIDWLGFRQSNSGTNGSQLYINNSAYGSATTSFTDTYAQHVLLQNVTLKAGDVVEVRARSRATNYSMFVGNLIIEEVI